VFFFQAEDGIRDRTVTGVQTCALPISLRGAALDVGAMDRRVLILVLDLVAAHLHVLVDALVVQVRRELPLIPAPADREVPRRVRSEERRVGKECRSRWTAAH